MAEHLYTLIRFSRFGPKFIMTIEMLQFMSISIHFNHKRCEKARKILKRPKKIFEGQIKGQNEKFDFFEIFS